MTIEETAAIAEIINAVAVTLTLLGLIVTIRQNTKSQKAMAVDSLAAAIAAINVPATQSPALGSALSSAVNDWASATRDVREVWWPNRRHAYSGEFQSFLAKTMPPDEIGSLAAIFDHAPAPVAP